MEVSEMSCVLPTGFMDQLFPLPDVPPAIVQLDASLARRLARAKARLDRLERDVASRDQSALATARVEFALASRTLADQLVARRLHACDEDDG